mgnify:CR=1 FL=1
MSQNISDLNHQAIKAALKQDWDRAVALNQHILQLNSGHIPGLNRLAKAYEKTGQIQQAKQTYQKVLKHDQYNNIAHSNLKRLRSINSSHTPSSTLSGDFSFIEEPGKTKTIWLTKVVTKLLPQLENSQRVKLEANRHRIAVLTQDDEHLGYLPDDLSAYLARLLRLGSKFEAAVKKIDDQDVQIFIKETRRSKRLKGLPAFTGDSSKNLSALPAAPLDESPLEIPSGEDPDDIQKVER